VKEQDSVEQFKNLYNEYFSNATVEKHPLGGSGIIIVSGVNFDTSLKFLREGNFIHPLHVYPNKPTFRRMSGDAAKLPDIVLTDGKLEKINTTYDVRNKRYIYGEWVFGYPVSYVATITYPVEELEERPAVTFQSLLTHKELVWKVTKFVPRKNLVIHKHGTHP